MDLKSGKIKNANFDPRQSWIEWLSDDWQYFSNTRVRIAYFDQKSES